MPITFDRSVCCDLNETISREWLVTNAQGGYAAGTVAGVLTRRQHGLLVALPPDATTPQLLLAKIDEEVIFDQRIYNLGTNEYRDGTLNPSGFVHLEAFRLEEGFPIFTYRLGGINGIMLQKRVWMPQGYNTTYIQYRLLRTTSTDSSGLQRSGITGALSNNSTRTTEYTRKTQRAVNITLLPFITSRPYDQLRYGNNNYHFQIRSVHHEDNKEEDDQNAVLSLPDGVAGCTISGEAYPFHVVAVGHPQSQVQFIPTGVWYWHFLHRHDRAEPYPATDDLYLPGVIRATLWPDEDATLTIIVSTHELSSLTLQPRKLNLSYKRSVERQQQLLHNALQPQRFFGEGGEAVQAHDLHVLPLTTNSNPDPYRSGEEYLQFLIQAGDRFLTRRAPTGADNNNIFGRRGTIPVLLTNYYETAHKTRDVLIALPGLTLVTKRYDEALRILRETSRHFKEGLLPYHLPLPNQTSQDADYGSADTTLWFFYALDCYLQATHNYKILKEFYGYLTETISAYRQGTPDRPHIDPVDGLISAPGKALTWMDAIVQGAAITPRSGKPVEINALWYYALSLLIEWSRYIDNLNSDVSPFEALRDQCKQSFQQRFWYVQGNYLYDVIDGPDGNDISLRPNQLFALSLRYPILEQAHQQSVFDAATQYLLTPQGLRTLAPQDPAYQGHLGETQEEQRRAFHQGSAWTWLLGPYLDAMLMLQKQIDGRSPQEESYLYQEHLLRKGSLLLEPLQKRFSEGLLGMNEGVFDGDSPHPGNLSCASAISTGELLRIYDILAHMRATSADHVFSR